MRVLLLTTLLASMALAGCADARPETSLTIDYAGERPGEPQVVQATVRIDDDPFPSLPFYQDQDGHDHPGQYTAFDQIVQWADTYALSVEVGYFDSLGFFLTRIDDVAADPSSQYWALEVNGESSNVGMEMVHLAEGDTIGWTLSTF